MTECATTSANDKPEPVRFCDKIEVRCPAEMSRAVAIAAARKQQRVAEWLRGAVRTALHVEGIDVAKFESLVA